eukprot:g8152.t1
MGAAAPDEAATVEQGVAKDAGGGEGVAVAVVEAAGAAVEGDGDDLPHASEDVVPGRDNKTYSLDELLGWDAEQGAPLLPAGADEQGNSSGAWSSAAGSSGEDGLGHPGGEMNNGWGHWPAGPASGDVVEDFGGGSAFSHLLQVGDAHTAAVAGTTEDEKGGAAVDAPPEAGEDHVLPINSNQYEDDDLYSIPDDDMGIASNLGRSELGPINQQTSLDPDEALLGSLAGAGATIQHGTDLAGILAGAEDDAASALLEGGVDHHTTGGDEDDPTGQARNAILNILNRSIQQNGSAGLGGGQENGPAMKMPAPAGLPLPPKALGGTFFH